MSMSIVTNGMLIPHSQTIREQFSDVQSYISNPDIVVVEIEKVSNVSAVAVDISVIIESIEN